MKIALIPHTCRISPQAHGYIKRMYHLSEGLVKLGHQVRIFAREDSLVPAGVELVKWLKPEKKDLASQHQYVKKAILASQDCDIINAQTDHLALPYIKDSKIPILNTIVYGRLENYILDEIKAYPQALFSTISNFLATKYSFIDFQGIIHNSLNITEFPFEENKADYFLYLARISVDKNTHLAVNWARENNFKLILAGSLDDENYFKEKIKPYLNTQIQYLGKLGFEKVGYLQKARATFLLDEYEGFGNSIIESLACGTPVIGFDSGSFPEIITHRKDGYILKDKKDIKNALDEITRIKPKNCRHKVEKKFTTEIMVKNYEKLYKKIISAEGR